MQKYQITKKGKIILAIFMILLIVIIVFIINNNKNKSSDFKLEKIEIEKSSETKILTDFKMGNISADEYVLYTAYTMFDNSKLPEKYKSGNNVGTAPDLVSLKEQYIDELSENTINYIDSKIYLGDVTVGKKESSVSYNSNNIKYMASENIEGKSLNKLVISENKKVIVWYTTDNGKYQTTDDNAKKIANEMEKIIEYIEKNYGIKYKWEPAYFNSYNEEKYSDLLKNNYGGNVEDILKSLPIYITDTADEDVLGYYTIVKPERYSNSPYGTGIPVGPFINVEADSIKNNSTEELNFVLAHELFHHFQQYQCGNGEYVMCERNTGSSNDVDSLFIQETSANYVASDYIKKTITITKNYFTLFHSESSKKMDIINSYVTFPFLKNYEKIVDNGISTIINAIGQKDTLNYLIENSNGKMPQVMNELSKNNIINNYDNEIYKGNNEYNISFIMPTDIKDLSDTLNGISIKYYMDSEQVDKYKISNTSNNDTIYINVFGLKDVKDGVFKDKNDNSQKISGYDSIKLLASTKLGNYQVVDTTKFEDYDIVCISLSNGKIDNSTIKIEKTDEEVTISDKIDSEDNVKKKKDKTYTIYVDDKETSINNFDQNYRAYVDINEFCKQAKICDVSFTDKNKDTIEITSKINHDGQKFEYTLIHKLRTKEFNSDILVGNQNYNLSQLSTDVSSCPTGLDSYGFDIPECDETNIYVPIRFVTQALGYEVIWDKESSTNINIYSNLQEKIIKEKNIKMVLSTEKVDIDEKVTNIVSKSNDKYKLIKNQKYYVYIVNEDDKRLYNSAFSYISGDKNAFKIQNDLDTDKNSKATYSSLTPVDNSSSNATIGLVGTITIEDEENNSKNGIYPIVEVYNFETK